MKLLLIDTTGIQPYVFGSNRLRENIGASYLVSEATNGWVKLCIATCDKVDKHNLIAKSEDVWQRKEDVDLRIESDNLDAEFIYAGGGNAVVLCKDSAVSKTFRSHYTRYLMENAPGLSVAIAECDVNLGTNGDFHTQLETLSKKEMPQQKQCRTRSAPMLGLGVSAACQSTGLPASDYTKAIPGADPNEETAYLASSEVLVKRDNIVAANNRLETMFRLPTGLKYPYDLDNLGRSHSDHSYIAVVHADGDNMGQQLINLAEEYNGKVAGDNRKMVQWWRDVSRSIKDTGKQALKNTIDHFVSHAETTGIVHENKNGFGEISRVEFKEAAADRWYLPLRPLVFGGDDITWVCDSRIAHSLTIRFIHEFEKAADEHLSQWGFKDVSASAGIAIVKSHYPFSRAYELASELTKSAKTYKKAIEMKEGKPIKGCIDWHFAMGGLLGTLNTIRKRHYCSDAGSLTLRPVTVGKNPAQDMRSWRTVRGGIDHFQDVSLSLKKPLWFGKRNKIKALRDELRKGPTAVKRFLTLYRPGARDEENKLPLLQGSRASSLAEYGWDTPDDNAGDGYCGYFDALELSDWFIPLAQNQNEEQIA